eukprot:Skav227422  [mRNA]  locus=scaffold1986:39791:50693:+ [translate_table: standard]
MVGAHVFTNKYKQVKLEEVAEKHSKLWTAASQYFQEGLPDGTIAGVKTGTVGMISTLALGFPKAEELKICAPWGEQQTKKADTDAWIVKEMKEADSSSFYLVNADPKGLPIGYVRASFVAEAWGMGVRDRKAVVSAVKGGVMAVPCEPSDNAAANEAAGPVEMRWPPLELREGNDDFLTVDRLAQLFDRHVDVQRRGRASLRELLGCADKARHGLAARDVELAVEEMDQDRDGLVTFEEIHGVENEVEPIDEEDQREMEKLAKRSGSAAPMTGGSSALPTRMAMGG